MLQYTPEALQRKGDTICRAGERLSRAGLGSGTNVNISIRMNDAFMIISPQAGDGEALIPGRMVTVEIGSLRYTGEGKPSAGWELHAAIYACRKEMNAIIIINSPNACMVAAAHREVPPLLDDMAQIIGPSLRVADYPISGPPKMIKQVIRALAGQNAVLLANQGALCLGRDLEEALVIGEILEKSCRTFIESEFMGGGVPVGAIVAWIMHQYYLRKYSKRKQA